MLCFFFIRLRIPPSATRTATLSPSTKLFRSKAVLPVSEAGTGTGAQALPVDLGTLLAAADPARGESVGKVCASCHTFRSEEHTSELQALMRISYAVCRLKKNVYSVVLSPTARNTIDLTDTHLCHILTCH